MTSEPAARDTASEPEGAARASGGRRLSPKWLAIVAAVIVVNAIAFVLVPPYPREGGPGDACPYPACFIEGTLEFPAPHVVFGEHAAADALVTFTPSISSTILTMWIVMAIVIVGAWLMVRGSKLIPGRAQNLFEWFYEFISDFGVGLAGPTARPYIPLFVAFFLLIIFSNWVGLIPPVGRIEELRAPSSDVNITLGLALVSFTIFEVEGFRRLGVRGYLGKFFPVYEFRHGIGAGIIAMFVGLVELMLEFVKPVTLSMRLFGNIYGGEVALGVMTALTIAFVPVALVGLEVMLNAIQALIFSVLSLMFIVLAIESHHGEEGQIAEDAVDTIEAEGRQLQPAH
ncbi:MAG: F0F1 ATP synthase subunit A [Chloroflexi bacterium]|nr:F0F1 ATP synthase subunit A [Chloroflexota bacterium]